MQCEEGRQIAAALYAAEEFEVTPPQIASSESSEFVQPMMVHSPPVEIAEELYNPPAAIVEDAAHAGANPRCATNPLAGCCGPGLDPDESMVESTPRPRCRSRTSPTIET